MFLKTFVLLLTECSERCEPHRPGGQCPMCVQQVKPMAWLRGWQPLP